MNRYIRSILILMIFTCSVIFSYAQETKNPSDSSSHNYSKRPNHIRPTFHYPGKRYFFQGQAVVGFLELGAHFVGGYRFGQFGILGLGFGVDGFQLGFQSNNSTDPYDGIYFPLYVHYSGDILKKRVTPFYSVEAGYAFRYSREYSYITVTPLDHPAYKDNGGFAGEVGFGVKLYGSRRVYATWSLNMDIKQGQDKYSNYYYNSIGEDIKLSYSSSAFFFIPAIKIAVGF
jgi:hypothetical protein